MAKHTIIVYTNEDGEVTVYVDGEIGHNVDITIVNTGYVDDGEPEIEIDLPEYTLVLGEDDSVLDAETVLDSIVGTYQADHPTARVIDLTSSGGLLLEHLDEPVHVFVQDEVYLEGAVSDNGGKPLTGWFWVTNVDHKSEPQRLLITLANASTVWIKAGLVKKVRP